MYRTTGRDQERVLLRIYRLVFPHAFAEESVLWPVMRRTLPDGQELTLEVEREHQEVNELVTRLERIPQDSPSARPSWIGSPRCCARTCETRRTSCSRACSPASIGAGLQAPRPALGGRPTGSERPARHSGRAPDRGDGTE
ncbi:hemerythrin domain-containing protein [Microbacteriaceae bacterium 4G12]